MEQCREVEVFGPSRLVLAGCSGLRRWLRTPLASALALAHPHNVLDGSLLQPPLGLPPPPLFLHLFVLRHDPDQVHLPGLLGLLSLRYDPHHGALEDGAGVEDHAATCTATRTVPAAAAAILHDVAQPRQHLPLVGKSHRPQLSQQAHLPGIAGMVVVVVL